MKEVCKSMCVAVLGISATYCIAAGAAYGLFKISNKTEDAKVSHLQKRKEAEVEAFKNKYYHLINGNTYFEEFIADLDRSTKLSYVSLTDIRAAISGATTYIQLVYGVED